MTDAATQNVQVDVTDHYRVFVGPDLPTLTEREIVALACEVLNDVNEGAVKSAFPSIKTPDDLAQLVAEVMRTHTEAMLNSIRFRAVLKQRAESGASLQ